MESILLYITDHYYIFAIAAGVLVISAIGFIVDEKKQELNKAKDVSSDQKAIKEQVEKNKKEKK